MRITVEKVVDHEAAVVPHQVDDTKLDAYLLRHGPRITDVVPPRTIAGRLSSLIQFFM